MNYLAFNIGGSNIIPPANVPQGGLANMEGIIRNALMVFLFAGTALCLVYIVWGGIQWITAGGDKSKIQGARAKVTIAIVGFIVLLLSYAIVGAVGYLFRVNLLKLS